MSTGSLCGMGLAYSGLLLLFWVWVLRRYRYVPPSRLTVSLLQTSPAGLLIVVFGVFALAYWLGGLS